MTARDPDSVHVGPLNQQAADAAELGRDYLDRWRERRTIQKRTRLVSPRNRRVLARCLRTIAKHANDRDAIRRRRDVLLHYRAATVRPELLEIAAQIERMDDPDPDCVAALHDLLAHTGDSPLYDPKVPFSELEAILDEIRWGL